MTTDGRLRRARALTLVTLAVNAASGLVLPAVGLWREPDPVWRALGAAGVLLFAVAHGVALYGVATPWLTAAARRRGRWAFAAAAVASVPLVAPAGAGWPTWAWLGASVVGTAFLLTGRAAALAVVAVTVAAGAVLGGGDLTRNLVVTAGVGLGIAAVNGLQVWFWDLLLQADRGRAAQARLAATEERLRFARDVHDLLGHSLSVIALKAELAARSADPAQARREAAEVRELAAAALAELREVVHGYRAVDLREQLAAIAQVLTSSGVRCTVTAPDGDLPEAAAGPLSAVLREASTNLLRHSRAAWCAIELTVDGAGSRLTVTNDGAGEAVADRHSSGLRGLADRLAEAGGTLRTRTDGDRFTVDARMPG
ncbi:sensor histidine kinase [Spirilliplanes yamanashiensis]|uniref:Signal transduction histidine kinase subgroup 3 dimerisation and phosphoacceptor domain-containing protein n=1 Tax=Spirilliplanes yamanashiensis TaxID=42233 RepID=A0A8J4DI89_9ACTN|nr:histidine kinase [Spirilliplanes yamanashiensis]MDP9819258.1 two-component system sensor histidine kinase DesK [Spirilliplanes yamanashiensis]GIJ01918.1 hypothetical protein Sya03_12700 [Spirilliplanes yamanashiensis]